ncbi:hypothetical protein OAC41_04195 [Acidimicrobiales bacterium]|nr:hypothetical protein [Acidimicrobiales bacterium]
MSVAALLSADDEHAALEQLHTMGCTDGLPVVIPTAERVARMVLATGYDGDLVLGAMGPNMGGVFARETGCCGSHGRLFT